MRISRLTHLTVVAALLLSLTSLAHAAPFAYVTQGMSNTVTVIDTATGQSVATLEVGFLPWGVAVSPEGTRVYVASSFSDTVSVIDTTTKTVIDTITLGQGEEAGPFGVAVHPDGSRVYVTNQITGSVAVIDTTTKNVVSIPVGLMPAGVAVDPQGNRLYVANIFSNDVSIVDLATQTVITTVQLPGDPATMRTANPVGVAVDATGTRLYVTCAGVDSRSSRRWAATRRASPTSRSAARPLASRCTRTERCIWPTATACRSSLRRRRPRSSPCRFRGRSTSTESA
jgi:YVTN family beta-propeller protein